MQVKLLRVLDGVAYYRLGGTRKVTVDVRMVAATNQDLEKMVETGQFRGDLYHRLGQICLRVPPLRERPEDIVPLAEHFLKQSNPRLIFSGDALTGPGVAYLAGKCARAAQRSHQSRRAGARPGNPRGQICCWHSPAQAPRCGASGHGFHRLRIWTAWKRPPSCGCWLRPTAISRGRGAARHLTAHAEPEAETLRKGGGAAVLRFLSSSAAVTMSAADRRSERRHRGPWAAEAFLRRSRRRRKSLAELLDYSNSGFRAVHAYTALHTGQVVDFQHAVAVGQARVMWNRIADDRVETGFLVIK